jgi:hypothetical protein
VVEEEWTKAKPAKMDYRTLRKARRTELAKHLAITSCEFVEKNRTLELGTMKAFIGEIAERVGQPPGVELIEPTIAVLWAREDHGDDAATAEAQEEQKAWRERIENAKVLLICVWSDNPMHYTYLKVTEEEFQDVAIEYRDSLKVPSESAKEAATRIPRKLFGPEVECPPPSEQLEMPSGWVVLRIVGDEVVRARPARAPRRGPPAAKQHQRHLRPR